MYGIQVDEDPGAGGFAEMYGYTACILASKRA